MAAKKKAPSKADNTVTIRLAEISLKKRMNVLNQKMGHNSMNRIAEVALTIGVAVMERPEYWAARLDGVPDEEVAKYIIQGLEQRAEEERKK